MRTVVLYPMGLGKEKAGRIATRQPYSIISAKWIYFDLLSC